MSELRHPKWQKPYHEALLEPNPQKLVQRVNEAERAILSRLQEIRIGSDNRTESAGNRRRPQWFACSQERDSEVEAVSKYWRTLQYSRS
jgi:hypothetical protein